jgi:hypothetical protein
VLVTGQGSIIRRPGTNYVRKCNYEYLLPYTQDGTRYILGFAADTVERLIAAADPVERPFVGALCFAQKSDGKASFFGVRYRAQPTVYDFAEIDGKVGFISRVGYERDALVTADGTGAACVLIHRSLLVDIEKAHGKNWYTPIIHPTGPTTFSEDLSFCARAATLGVQLHIHTGIKTTHDKGGVFLDEEFFDRQQVMLAAAT